MSALLVVALTSCIPSWQEVDGASAKEILDEVIAGVDANIAWIESGSARYKKSLSLYVDNVEQPAVTETLSVWFRGQDFRWNGQRTCGLFVAKQAFTFSTTDPADPPFKTNIILRERALSSDKPELINPRTLGHCVAVERDKCFFISDLIRSAQQDDLKEILVARDDGSLVLTFRIRREKAEQANQPGMKTWKAIYRIDPKQGYGVTRREEFGIPDWPGSEADTTYVSTSNGAFVAKNFEGHERGRKDGRRKEMNHVIIELLDVDLQKVPGDDDFTLAAMGVPRGARIQDRIENREYLFDIAAVTEDEIKKEWRRMRNEHEGAIHAHQRSRRNWTIGATLGAVVLLTAAFVGYRIRRASVDR